MGAQHLRVPYGLIRQLCYPGGTRLAPRITKIRPPEPDVDAEHIGYSYHPPTSTGEAAPTIIRPVLSAGFNPVLPANMGLGLHLETSQGELSSMGNLSNEAYKFFKGSVIVNSNYFQCRGCLIEEAVKERKLVHMRDCRVLMQRIEERIKRDRVCVICNLSTSRDRWKIPLCSEACVTKWRFLIPSPWMIARRFVLAAEPSLMRK